MVGASSSQWIARSAMRNGIGGRPLNSVVRRAHMRAGHQLKYVELKSGYNDNGPAWIGYVRTSRSGQTIYFNGRAMRQIARGRYRDIESGEVFWISGLKKNAEDRHWAGSGKVLVERRAIPEYLALVGATKLDLAKYAEFDAIVDVDLERFHRLENRSAWDAKDEGHV